MPPPSFRFPAVSSWEQLYKELEIALWRDYTQYLIHFSRLALILPITAVLDKISKQLVLKGKKNEVKLRQAVLQHRDLVLPRQWQAQWLGLWHLNGHL